MKTFRSLYLSFFLYQALHVHATDTTYKLLDRKGYDVHERPKMTVNGTVPITTYFILGKKDRAGKSQSRPFQAVLEAMKKQETEEAKIKQSTSLKGGLVQNLPPPPAPAPVANGFAQPSPQMDPNSMPTESVDMSAAGRMVRNDGMSANPGQNPAMRSSEMLVDQNNLAKSYNQQQYPQQQQQQQQAQSKTCELL
jgi:hypothetical protein